MVPTDKNGSQLARARCDLVRICAITNDIAQVVNLVVFGSGVQASLKRFKVGMNVRENQYAQTCKSLMRLKTTECINYCGDTRAQCPGAISSKGTAPAGRASFSTIASGRARSVFNVGIALINPRVYEWRAEEKIPATEIGRASCRERVEISVVAV